MKHNKYILQSLVSLQEKAVKHEWIINDNVVNVISPEKNKKSPESQNAMVLIIQTYGPN